MADYMSDSTSKYDPTESSGSEISLPSEKPIEASEEPIEASEAQASDDQLRSVFSLKATRASTNSQMSQYLVRPLREIARMRLQLSETFEFDPSLKAEVLEEQTKVDSLEATLAEMQRKIGEFSFDDDDFLRQQQRLEGQVVVLSQRISDRYQRARNRHKLAVSVGELKKELEATKATLFDQAGHGRVAPEDNFNAKDYFGRIQTRLDYLETCERDPDLSADRLDELSTEAANMLSPLEEVNKELKAVPDPGRWSGWTGRRIPPRGWVETMKADPTYSPSDQKK